MSQIPEGATHWAKDSRCYNTGGVQYYRLSAGHRYQYLNPRGIWTDGIKADETPSIPYFPLPVGQAPVIDWSKAPEDATHGRVTTAGVDFYKRILGEWVYLNSRNQWERAYGTSEANCEERPQPTPAALRNKTCDEMFGVILKMPEDRRHNRSDIVEALYDAGYRKFEIVDGEA